MPETKKTTTPIKKQKANYGALFNASAAVHPGAFLQSTASQETPQEEIIAVSIPLDKLLDNPFQPRLEMNEESLSQLAQTIKDQGFQGVLVARRHPTEAHTYQIAYGHRRREASKKAGLTELPVIIKDLSDQDMVAFAVTENIQREDLTPLEEGKTFSLMTETMGMTLEQVASTVKKSESYVRNRRRVAMAPEDIQQLVARKPDSLRAVIYLLKIEDKSTRAKIIDLLIQGQLTADQVDQYVKTLEEKTSVFQVQEDSKTPLEQNTSMIHQREQSSSSIPENLAQIDQATSLTVEKHFTNISKLKTVLKTLKTYATQYTEQTVISSDEQDLLEQISQVIDGIKQHISEEHVAQ